MYSPIWAIIMVWSDRDFPGDQAHIFIINFERTFRVLDLKNRDLLSVLVLSCLARDSILVSIVTGTILLGLSDLIFYLLSSVAQEYLGLMQFLLQGSTSCCICTLVSCQ